MADSVSGEADRRSDISACTEDRTEMAENNKTQINVKKKKKNSIIKSVKGSFLSPKNKEADNKTKRTNTENDLGNSLDDPQSPSSPSKYQIFKVLEKYIFLHYVFSKKKWYFWYSVTIILIKYLNK